MIDILNEPLTVILGIQLALLCIASILWSRQSRILRHLEEERQWNASGFDRLQELQRSQERVLLSSLSQTDDQRRQQMEVLQRRLLVQVSRVYQALERRFGEMQTSTTADAGRLRLDLIKHLERSQQAVSQALAENRLSQQEGLTRGLDVIGQQLMAGLGNHGEELGRRMDGLAASTEQRLRDIGGLVEKRLSEGFDRTTETFNQVLQHLTRIDEAQRRITELSSNVVSLQEVLADKRSRGAFGEVQLNSLVRNLMPENSFALQHTLNNGTRADCMLFLPEPTGNIAVDSKFPLESYRRMTDHERPESDRAQAAMQFRRDIRRHISDIANKYIVPDETSQGAVMFIPAESVFAEIHGHFPELVEEAWRLHVWLVSPTTMMAVLTTARAVLKDAATREQIDLIQQHLHLLSRDFNLFQERMARLSRHIGQANRDVNEVQVSARKISDRFERIEQVELDQLESPEP